MMWKIWLCYAIPFLFFSASAAISQQPFDYDYPTAHLSTSWRNAFNSNVLETRRYDLYDASTIRPILLRVMARESDWSDYSSLAYACGFYCIATSTCDSYLFGIFIVQIYNGSGGASFYDSPQLVWSANRNKPVGENATVELNYGGELVLRDADRTLVWSTNTARKAVAGLNLTEMGNLVLYDANRSVVWQSFDHPTDCLLVGQILGPGKNLTSAASQTNWSSGLYSVWMSSTGLFASIGSNSPQVYHRISYAQSGDHSYAEYKKGSLELYAKNGNSTDADKTIDTHSKKAQYIKLEADGRLRVFEWGNSWEPIFDILTSEFGACAYPMACGRYGICSNGQCSCPKESFRQENDEQPESGCSPLIPLTCNASQNHSFLDLNNMTYFTFNSAFTSYSIDFYPDINNTNFNRCKEACLKNCSCKAAMFVYESDSSDGFCFLPTEIFSLTTKQKSVTYYTTYVSIKVQTAPTNAAPAQTNNSKGKGSSFGIKLGSIIGAICLGILFTGIGIFAYLRRQRKTEAEDVEEGYLDHVPGMPTRFSVEELVAATANFSNKLGEGGFGSVYEGLLSDGTRIAVKRLDGVNHIKKSFLTEVETISSIHHINLVRLIGFCAEKSHRLLVYEHMCNGSLDKWIYSKAGEATATLDWNQRRTIILDIAKGLSYLHEECVQKIFHLDIKPQNILLDEHYNAKLADFGLSKLMDRDQSKVVTTMRGTPGYLAPEWLSAVITEKVDVYSFGVVILEILTGRRIFEAWRPEKERYLLEIFKKKCEEGKSVELACQNMEAEVAEVDKMMQISAWCLQSGYDKRPSMSLVIKVLEGVMEVPRDIDFNLLIPHYLIGRVTEASFHDQGLTPLLPSVLSRPR